MSQYEPVTGWVPEEDRAEQLQGTEPEPAGTDDLLPLDLPEGADQADAVEQARELPPDDDDRR